MTTDRIQEIQFQTAYPNSQSVANGFKQVWHEVHQEYKDKIRVLTDRAEKAEAKLTEIRKVLGS